jgi:hypothetical protein
LVSASCQGQQHSGRCLSCPAGPETPYREHELRASTFQAKRGREPKHNAPERGSLLPCAVQAARHFVEHSVGGEAFRRTQPCGWAEAALPDMRECRTLKLAPYYSPARNRANRFDQMRSRSRPLPLLPAAHRRNDGRRRSGRVAASPVRARSAKHGLLSTWPTQILGGCYTASARFCRNGR